MHAGLAEVYEISVPICLSPKKYTAQYGQIGQRCNRDINKTCHSGISANDLQGAVSEVYFDGLEETSSVISSQSRVIPLGKGSGLWLTGIQSK